MRALKMESGSMRLLAELPEVACPPGEAIIAPTRVLLSPADVAAAGIGSPPGESRPFEGVLGSQFVGIVRKINLPADAGPLLAARKTWVGKRVVGSPTLSCGSCDLCRHGLAIHCRARKVLGVFERDGCLAESFAMPMLGLSQVSDAVSDDKAAFAHVLSSALHAVNMLRGQHASFITVLGDGVLALLTAQALARMNKTVRVLSSRPQRQKLCEKWGIKHRALEEPGRRQDQDVVVDCTGSSAGLRLALQLVRPRGIVLLKSPLGLAPFPPGRPLPEVGPGSTWAAPVDLTPAIVNEVQIVGSRDGPIPDALRMLAEDAIDVLALIGRRFKLDEAPAAMRAAALPESLGVMIDL
ncbi:MAG TPA: alcohol dehydrogenase catalytic domain-containing protein [Phycisphaerales bacterium]|nr:alcohol dehydrogenase catalytic domain-containing protein [Phycisphaerales bacterium]